MYKNKNKQKRILFIVTTLFISLIALIFVIMNFRDQIVFFYSPAELLADSNRDKILKRQVRVGGLVVAKTVKKIDSINTEFVITDLKQELKIVYVGLLPDLFRENQGIVAKGKLDQDSKIFIANELLVKHDEKYMPPEIYKKIRKNSEL